VLFRDGQPVFSKYVPSSTAGLVETAGGRRWAAGQSRSDRDRLVPLRDPFRADTSLTRPRSIPTSWGFAGLSNSSGLPESGVELLGSVTRTRLIAFDTERVALPHLLLSSPRAPPLPL
jgi:hypothetical protein